MKNFKFLLLIFILLVSGPSLSFDEDQLKKIQDNLCADDQLNKVQTEAAAPCVDCVAKEMAASIPTSELKSVAQKVLTELEQAEVDKLELEFFKFVDERGLLSSGSSKNDSLEAMEENLKTYQSIKESTKAALDSYKSLNNFESKKDLTESQSSGVMGPKTKEILKKHFLQNQKYFQGGVESTVAYYDKTIKFYKEQLADNPKEKTINKSIQAYEEAKVNFLKSGKTFETILKWLESSGKKIDLKSEDWVQVQSVLIDKNQTAETSSLVIQNYNKTLQSYELEIAMLKANIDEKKNVKNGEIHSPGTQEHQEEKLKGYRKKAEQINLRNKSNIGYKDCGMSEAEILAIRWYTSSHYSWINKALRLGGEEAQKIEVYKKVLNRALEKLRAYEGVVRRGTTLPESVAAQHEVGKIVEYQAYTSTSLASGWSGTHKFVIKSKKGRYVGSHSAVYHENEVLFAAGTKFKIIARDAGKITMEEVEP